MAKDLKVGDRVRCSGQPECGSFSCPTIEGDLGTVNGYDPSGWVQITLDVDYGKPIYLFHPRQCRKLRPKRVAREWEVCIGMDGNPTGIRTADTDAFKRFRVGHFYADNDLVRVREILPKKGGGK